MKINDGGPAFPVECSWSSDGKLQGLQTSAAGGWETGMSLRDWFAGQALAGGMVSDTMKEYQLAAAFGSNRTGITREEIIVANAYRRQCLSAGRRDAGAIPTGRRCTP